MCVNTDKHAIQTLFKPAQSMGGILIHKTGTRKVENAAYKEAIDNICKFVYSWLHHYLDRASDLHAEHFTELMVKYRSLPPFFHEETPPYYAYAHP